MNFRYIPLMALLCFVLVACQEEVTSSELDLEIDQHLTDASNGAGPSFFQLPRPNEYNQIPQDPRNPINSEKVRLGQLLYHETGLALDPMRPEGENRFSCASCHFASAGFQAGRQQGIGEGGEGIGNNGAARRLDANYMVTEIDVQPIRTPTTLNVAYQKLMLWNGQFGATDMNTGTEDLWTEGTPKEVNHLGYEGVEIQAIAGLDVHRLVIDREMLQDFGYMNLFDAAFPELPEEERYTNEIGGLAIAAYERTLVANNSPWQRYLRGELEILSMAEKRGASLFFGKANCVACHTGPALNSMTFHALGMADLDECVDEVFNASPDSEANLGRGGFTGRPWDMYMFKTPQLYNLTDSPFYGHGSSFNTVREVVEYKNSAVVQTDRMHEDRIAEEFVPLGLTSEEIDDLVAFLEKSLYDPNLERYEPESLLSGFCFPNNDPISQDDLGCN